MANGKLPPEIHLLHGTKGMNQGITLPEKIKKRIPFAEWAKNPESFTKEKFVDETAEYLYEVYGIGSHQDRHTLMMLADQLQLYIDSMKEQGKHPLIIKINGGKTFSPNPYIALANKAMDNCIKLMGELGLTPKSRLAAQEPGQANTIDDLLRGPRSA
jgi:phage terminase small subunit